MRTKTICISERELMFAIGGQLFEQAPNRQPRNAEKIMEQIRDNFRKDTYSDNDYYSLRIAESDLYKYVDSLLKNIKEFIDLNLSQYEFEQGVSVDDEKRPKYSFIDRYSRIPWKSDFIDLDAFVRNVVNNIWKLKDANEDCFCCVNSKTNKCNSCIVNEEFKNNYECSRNVKGNYTFACKFDCYKSFYICCEECKEKETCSKKCHGHSKTCGNAIFQDKEQHNDCKEDKTP